MELTARDLKALGVYTARSLSYDDVTYERLEHPLSLFEREVYDELAGRAGYPFHPREHRLG